MPIIDNSPPALTNPNATDKLNSPPHATQHANVNDEIEAISDTLIAGLVQEAAAVVRVSNTQFTVAGDVTAYYTIGRKLVTNHAGTPVAVTVSASSYSAPNTTVTVVGNNLPTPLNTVALSTEPKGNTQAKAEAIATDAVETAKIKDANVTTAKIANDAVTDDKLDFPRFWQEIGRTTLGAVADVITVSGLTAKKYLKILVLLVSSGVITPYLRFNNDSANNYAWRRSSSGGADTATVSTAQIVISFDDLANPSFIEILVINEATREKLAIAHSVDSTGEGAATAPSRTEVVGKWANTADAITRVDLVNTIAGDFSSGSGVVVLGHD